MSRILPLAAISIAAILSGCTHQPAQNPPAAPPTIVFMTDFGTANDSVAICKAVIIGIAPGVRIMDITHKVTPFSIEEGASFLAGVSPYYHTALDDPYDSMSNYIPVHEFRNPGYALGDTATLRLGNKPFTALYVKTFMDVAVGRPLLYVDSRGQMGLALNQRNFSRTYGIAPPTPIFIPRKR